MNLADFESQPLKFAVTSRQKLLSMIADGTYDPLMFYVTQSSDHDGTRLFPYLGKQELGNNSIQYKRFTHPESMKTDIQRDSESELPGKVYMYGEFRLIKAAPIVMITMDVTMQITRRYLTQFMTDRSNRMYGYVADFLAEVEEQPWSNFACWSDIGQPEISPVAFYPDVTKYQSKNLGCDVGHFVGGPGYLVRSDSSVDIVEGYASFPAQISVELGDGYDIYGNSRPQFLLRIFPMFGKNFMSTGTNEIPGADRHIADTQQNIRFHLHHTITYMGDFKVANPTEPAEGE